MILYLMQKDIIELQLKSISLRRYVSFQFLHKQVTDLFTLQYKVAHRSHRRYFFNYYMKTYFKYFNLEFPSNTNQ
jgi:hypothetical protein